MFPASPPVRCRLTLKLAVDHKFGIGSELRRRGDVVAVVLRSVTQPLSFWHGSPLLLIAPHVSRAMISNVSDHTTVDASRYPFGPGGALRYGLSGFPCRVSALCLRTSFEGPQMDFGPQIAAVVSVIVGAGGMALIICVGLGCSSAAG
jgi:hypothetical protein